jgi:hypothetical protein
VKGGITGAFGRSRDRIRALGDREGSDNSGPAPEAKPTDSGSPAARADGGGEPSLGGLRKRASGSFERLRSDHRLAIVWVAAGLLVVAWIGWTAYVWSENGAAAGLGVLISWPAVFAALALIATPLVGAGVLVHRHRPAGPGPQAADAADGGGETAGAGATDAASSDADAEPKAEEAEEAEEPAEDDGQEEAASEPDDDEAKASD